MKLYVILTNGSYHYFPLRGYFLVCKCQQRGKRFQWKSKCSGRDKYLKINNTFEGMQEKVDVTRIVFYIENMILGSTVA